MKPCPRLDRSTFPATRHAYSCCALVQHSGPRMLRAGRGVQRWSGTRGALNLQVGSADLQKFPQAIATGASFNSVTIRQNGQRRLLRSRACGSLSVPAKGQAMEGLPRAWKRNRNAQRRRCRHLQRVQAVESENAGIASFSFRKNPAPDRPCAPAFPIEAAADPRRRRLAQRLRATRSVDSLC